MKKKTGDVKIDKEFIHKLHERLFSWWKYNRKSYPWRWEKDPYRILIAELFLHRTQTPQAEKVYRDFISRFPDIHSLSDADENEIHTILTPLGLNWRIRKIINILNILRNLKKIPDKYEELESLPGVGNYIASATLVFAHNRPLPLLDTNTVRVAGRLLGMKITDSSRRSKNFREAIQAIMDKENPRDFFYALIDLGQQVCRARNPDCCSCPLQNICKYSISRKKKRQED